MTGIISIIDRQPGFYTVNMNFTDTGTSGESGFTDDGNAIRDCYARQVGATGKSRISNAGDIPGDIKTYYILIDIINFQARNS